MSEEGKAILKDAIKEVTLDLWLDGNPKVINADPEAYKELVKVLRTKRAMFIDAEQKKKSAKSSAEEQENED